MEEKENVSECLKREESIAECFIHDESWVQLGKKWNGEKWNYIVLEIPDEGEMKTSVFGDLKTASSFFVEIVNDCLI